MIDVLDRLEARGIFHKTLIARALPFVAGFVPGGSTALGIGQSFLPSGGGGGGATCEGVQVSKLRKRAARKPSGNAAKKLARCAAQAPSPSRGAPPPPSIPPVNPVRTAVIQAKQVAPLKKAPRPKRRVPQVFPISRPHVSIPRALTFPGSSTTPTRSQAMPIHRKIRDFLLPPAGPAANIPCFPPARMDPRTGECRVFAGTQTGVDDAPIGQAIMGRFGAAYEPGNMVIDRAVCLPGDVVGSDGLCYPRRSIKNSDREWPRGRRPLLTGGDMRAISIAHRAGARMTRAAGRLQDMGIIKKPIVRKQSKKKH